MNSANISEQISSDIYKLIYLYTSNEKYKNNTESRYKRKQKEEVCEQLISSKIAH